MFSSIRNKTGIVNYLSLRAQMLDSEDNNHITILVHQILQGRYIMASRLLKRGAKVDFVNSDGHTALHICIDNRLIEQCKFLLQNGANPHIMDIQGRDVCDKAKLYGIVKIDGLDNCSVRKKIIPVLPDGKHP